MTVALGECGHPAQSPWLTIDDPICNFAPSGPGGIWQVTSQDADDITMAGCSNGVDCCCNARLAYAHAYNQGGATVIPDGYCARDNKDCAQIYSDCGGKTGPKWNNVTVDLTYKADGALIPDCSHDRNPYYPDGGAQLASVTIDQEPCYLGPFSIAAGGVGKEFFPGFYGWGATCSITRSPKQVHVTTVPSVEASTLQTAPRIPYSQHIPLITNWPRRHATTSSISNESAPNSKLTVTS